MVEGSIQMLQGVADSLESAVKSLRKRQAMVKTTSLPFDKDTLEQVTGIKNWDSDFTFFWIQQKDKLYGLIQEYVQKTKLQSIEIPGLNHSYAAKRTYKEKEHPLWDLGKERPEITEKKKRKGEYKHNSVLPSLGLFRFKWKPEEPESDSAGSDNQDEELLQIPEVAQTVNFFAYFQAFGDPNPPYEMHASLVLFVEGRDRADLLQTLLDYIVELDIRQTKIDNLTLRKRNNFNIYRYNDRYLDWMRTNKAKGRSLESVILEKEKKDLLLKDIDDFLSKQNQLWYLEHGIPYKRSYLLHGVPGTGKTSIISALASHYGRDVCFLNPSHPKITDDILQQLMRKLPDEAFLVLEDIDALFDENRQRKNPTSVTFSGLLNSLDGIGGDMGQLVFLTTNHRERLNPALIRNGRIDIQIKFESISKLQAEEMFKKFYKHSSKDEQKQFSKCLFKAIRDRGNGGSLTTTPATLQHFFIMYRKCSIEKAIAEVGEFVKQEFMDRQTDTQKQEQTGSTVYS